MIVVQRKAVHAVILAGEEADWDLVPLLSCHTISETFHPFWNKDKPWLVGEYNIQWKAFC